MGLRPSPDRAAPGELLAKLLVLLEEALELPMELADHDPQRVKLRGGLPERSGRVGTIGRGHEREKETSAAPSDHDTAPGR